MTTQDYTGSDIVVLWDLAGRPASISMVAKMIATCSDENLRLLLPQLPEKMIMTLAKSKTKRDQRILECLADLAVNTHSFTYAGNLGDRLCANSNTPARSLRMLARVCDEAWQMRVGKNPNTSADTLFMLKDSHRVKVRRSVASNVNAPPLLLALLVDDQYAEVRSAALKNPDLNRDVLLAHLHTAPMNVLTFFSYHSTDPDVLRAVHHAQGFDQWRSSNLIRNFYTPVDVLEEMYAQASQHGVSYGTYAFNRLCERLGVLA